MFSFVCYVRQKLPEINGCNKYRYKKLAILGKYFHSFLFPPEPKSDNTQLEL